MAVQHKPLKAGEREGPLDYAWVSLTELEDAITAEEQRERRMTDAGRTDLARDFPGLSDRQV